MKANISFEITKGLNTQAEHKCWLCRGYGMVNDKNGNTVKCKNCKGKGRV